MPIYSYICEDCTAEFEAFASIQKKEAGWQPECPKCGSRRTRQVFKPTASISRRGETSSALGCCSNRGRSPYG